MPLQASREVEHEITVAAPSTSIYQLLADVADWPRIFPPTIHAERLEYDGTEERIRIWATANGTAKNWTSRRVLDADRLRIDFRQELSAPPVAAMGGAWVIEALSGSESRVRLLHDYRAVDDNPDDLAWIDAAVDGNSRSELAALKKNVELAHTAADATFSFVDTVRIDGSAKDAYGFVDEADRWAQRLPHVSRVNLVEESPGLQLLEMDTRARDGSLHTTRSYRVCLPHHKIVYKQVTMPALMALHTGCWTFEEDGDGVLASSQHTVVLNTDAIGRILGDGAGVDDAREYVRGALSTNSRVTLGHAKDHTESARRR